MNTTIHLKEIEHFDFACSMNSCFAAFDKDHDGKLNLEEFHTLCRALFRNAEGQSYDVPQRKLQEVFKVFDTNGDGGIDQNEFVHCWNRWITIIIRPVSAALIVDVQNDFISGSLKLNSCPLKHSGEDVVLPINNLLDTVNFSQVVYSYDWHPDDHISFIDNVKLRKLHKSSPVANADKAKVFNTVVFDGDPPITQKLWPRHCVQHTWGSQLHKDLKIVDNSFKIYKGTNSAIDSYSLFWDNQRLSKTNLDSLLKDHHVTDLYLCGLAYDVCVAYTAKDAIQTGYRTILVDDCCRGIDLTGIEITREFLRQNNGVIAKSGEVQDMVDGRNRLPELGYKLAAEIGHRN